MPKCSFCENEGHKITTCRDPRIATVMNAVETAGSSANLNRVLHGFTSSELSVAMVQYGIPGVGVSKQRKIELLLNRSVRSTMASRLQEIREPVAAPTRSTATTQSIATTRRRAEPVHLSVEDIRELAVKTAKDVCAATFAQATILYRRFRDGVATIEECVEKYNDYRRMIVSSALREMNSGPEDYITLNDYSSMVYEEMNCIVRLRSSRIARTIYTSLHHFGDMLTRSLHADMNARIGLFRNREYLLMREAMHENLLSPNEMDDVRREVRRLLLESPIQIAPSPPPPESHLKPLCIEVKRSSSKIDDVLARDGVEECMICMTSFESKEAPEIPLMMGCEHICCTGCFMTLAKTRKKSFITCPFCREEVAHCTTPNKESMELVALTIKNA